MTSFRVVIPTRYNATRLPGKPLLEIAGRTLIAHVVDRALESGAEEVIVATEDYRVAEVVEHLEATLCITRTDHNSGTDRIAEVVEQGNWPDENIVVNLQGDEPQMPPALIKQVAEALDAHPDAAVATLCNRIESVQALFDTNIVKVVLNAAGYAQYFSRSVIPWQRDYFATTDGASLPPDTDYFRHLGIYAYRAKFLRRYAHMSVAPDEAAESLEQLRVLWYGERIYVSHATVEPPVGVDTQADLNRVRREFSSDP